MQGRVKFHRKITEREWYSDANTFRVFFHLITIANHKDGKRQGIDVKRGQTITGRIELAKKLNLSEMQIRTALDKLERTGEISKKTTNRFTIITVLKYCDYNDHDQEDNQQITNKQPTDNQQITTNKNDKNKKNEKELIVFVPPTLQEVIDHLITKGYNETLANKFFDYFTAQNRKVKGGKQMQTWKGAIAGWYDDKYKIKYTTQQLTAIVEELTLARQQGGIEAVKIVKEKYGKELIDRAVEHYNNLYS